MILVRRLALLAPLAHACSGAAAQDQVLRRAAFELRCPEEQLQIIELDERTQGVRGCGYQVTYVEVCSGPRGSVDSECSWVQRAAQPLPGTIPPGPAPYGPPAMPPVQPSLRPPIQSPPPARAPR